MTRFTCDWQGRQLSRTLPEGQTETFEYNADGQLTRHTDLNGRTTTYTYDDRIGTNGRLLSKTFADGTTESYIYDMWGRVVQVVSGGVTERTTYTENGQLESVTTTTNGIVLDTIRYEYDGVTGALIRTYTTQDENTYTDVRYTYDELGRLKTVETHAREGEALATPEQAEYFYNLLGTLRQIVYANGVTTTYDYNDLNQLINVVHKNAHDEVLLNTAYDLLANGFKWREVTTDATTRQEYQWTYDAMGRLVTERYDHSEGRTNDYEATYLYDLVGNRLEKRTDKELDGTINEAVKSTFDRNDRVLTESKFLDNQAEASETTTYHWGVDGRSTEQTGKTVTTGETITYTEMKYNAQGRLSEIVIQTTNAQGILSTVMQEYTYDPSGIKIRQTETTYQGGADVVESVKDTTYVTDHQNHTGYAQVLEEHTTEQTADGTTTKVTTYTIGHDVLTQAGAAMEAALAGSGILHLLYDGHG